MILRLQRNLEVSVFTAWANYVAEAHGAMASALARWQHAGAASAFDTWREFSAARRRFMELGTKMVMRYRLSLQATSFLAWTSFISGEREKREKSTLRTMALISGKTEMLTKIVFEAWRDVVASMVGRRFELVNKFVQRYRNAGLAECYQSWVAFVANEAAERQRLQERAMALLTGKQELIVRLYFDTFVRNVRQAIAARAAAAASAPPAAPAAQFEETASVLLRTSHSLSEAVAELRAAGADREATANLTAEEAARANEATEARLASIENELKKTARLLERSEKLLVPLPAAAVDQAAYSMMREEVVRLGTALASTQRQMATMQTSKASRHEFSGMRNDLLSFLYGTPVLAAPVAAALPQASKTPHELFEPPRSMPFEAPLQVQQEGATLQQQGVEAGGRPPMDGLDVAYAPVVAVRQPRPPSARRSRPAASRPGSAVRQRTTDGGAGLAAGSAPYRPSSARVTNSAAALPGAQEGARRPGSARPGSAAPRILAGAGGTVGESHPATSTSTSATATLPAGGFVEVSDLSELFEERGATARRTAGRSSATARRPPSASATRPNAGAARLPDV